MAHMPGNTVARAKKVCQPPRDMFQGNRTTTRTQGDNTEDKFSAANAVPRSSKDLGGWFNCSCFTNRYLACLTLIRPRRSLYPTPIGAMTKLNYSLNYDLNC